VSAKGTPRTKERVKAREKRKSEQRTPPLTTTIKRTFRGRHAHPAVSGTTVTHNGSKDTSKRRGGTRGATSRRRTRSQRGRTRRYRPSRR